MIRIESRRNQETSAMLHSNFNRLIATIRLCRRGCRHFHFQELCRRRLV